MSSVDPEDIILTAPNGSSLDTRLSLINVDTVNVATINLTGTINGQALSGNVVSTNATQTLTNKTLQDTTTRIADATDGTIKIAFDAAGTTGTTGTLKFAQAANRTYTMPDSGVDCQVVTTEGAQTINGAKTFTGLSFTNITVGSTTIYGTGTGNTVGAVTSDIYTQATANNTAYLLRFSIVGATAGGNTAIFITSVRAKNVGGVLTVGTSFDIWTDADAAISAATVAFVASGTNVIVRATGVGGQTIDWGGEFKVIAIAL